MATQDAEAAQLKALAAELDAIGTGIDNLETALAAAGGTTPAVDAALAALQTSADNAKAKLPVAPAPTPTPATPAP